MPVVNPILETLMHSQWTALRNYALGYEVQEHVQTKVLPVIEVSSPRVFVPTYGKEHLLIAEAERAMDTGSAMVKPAEIGEEFMTLGEYALQTELDHRRFEAVQSSQVGYDIIKHETFKLVSQIMNQSEKYVADTFQAVATYPAGHTATPVGNDAWTDADSNPIKQIQVGYGKIKSKGHTPNTITFGRLAWEQFRENPNVILEVHGKDNHKIVTEQHVKDLFGWDNLEIIIANGAYADGETFVDYFTDACIISRRSTAPADKRDLFTTSAGYQLRGKGQAAGPKVTVDWTDKTKKLLYIDVQMRLTNAILANDAMYLIKNTDAS